MDPIVFVAILFAAALHAGWNAAVKISLDPLIGLTLIVTAGGLIATPLLFVTGLPAMAAAPNIIASGLIHIVYNLSLVEAYRTGGLGFVYPVARGSAPLIVTLVSTLFLGETLTPFAYLGIASLVCGIGTLSFAGGVRAFLASRRAFGFASLTAVCIAAYSLIDAQGARLSGNPIAYSLMLYPIDMVVLAAILLQQKGLDGFRAMRPAIGRGIAGGAMQLVGYTVIIWAFSQAPVAMVSALRESSVLFAALLAVVLLKEPFGPIRAVATVLVCVGAILIKIG
jgi:drug/metabolite transporter (DMT)-like permease